MSTLNVETIKNPTSSNTVNSEQLVQGSATAWVNFNGTGTVAIRDSYNVSSLVDVGTGRYTIAFLNTMENSNYVAVVSVGGTTEAFNLNPPVVATRTINSCQVDIEIAGGTQTDTDNNDVVVFGGL